MVAGKRISVKGAKNKKYIMQRKIILASKSPRRIKLLKKAGLNFKAIKPDIDETFLIRKFKNYSARKLVKFLSLSKAVWVCMNGNLRGDEIIAGFDTVIEFENKIIGKPKNEKDALRIIMSLSNKKHKVYTGIGVIDLKKKIVISELEMTKVLMKKISKVEAKAYIKTKEPMDKAGAYAIQGRGKKFVKEISGDYFNVVGLPLKRFLSMIS